MLEKTLAHAGVTALAAAGLAIAFSDAPMAQGTTVFQATLGEADAKTPEVSTEELRRILADGSAIVLDSRKRSEYVAGHIAGAHNVDAPPAEYVAAVERLLAGDKTKPLVLYCNGQFCQASRHLAEQLLAGGFAKVRRYQLGIPIWRALGGPIEIELDGIMRIFNVDRTAVFFDARDAEEFSRGGLPGAHNVPIDQPAGGALESAPLPRDDFNTRVVLFGRDCAQARRLADRIGKTPFQNVSYYPGAFETLAGAIRSK